MKIKPLNIHLNLFYNHSQQQLLYAKNRHIFSTTITQTVTQMILLGASRKC